MLLLFGNSNVVAVQCERGQSCFLLSVVVAVWLLCVVVVIVVAVVVVVVVVAAAVVAIVCYWPLLIWMFLLVG